MQWGSRGLRGCSSEIPPSSCTTRSVPSTMTKTREESSAWCTGSVSERAALLVIAANGRNGVGKRIWGVGGAGLGWAEGTRGSRGGVSTNPAFCPSSAPARRGHCNTSHPNWDTFGEQGGSPAMAWMDVEGGVGTRAAQQERIGRLLGKTGYLHNNPEGTNREILFISGMRGLRGLLQCTKSTKALRTNPWEALPFS